MDFSSIEEALIPVRVAVDDAMVRVAFDGGLEIATPVWRFPRLAKATPDERNQWRLIGRGDGIHWPEIDEDISVRTLLSLPKKKPSHRMEEIPVLIANLLKTTQRLSNLFDGRPFTPDGQLVGSIGVVVAEYIYDLKPEAVRTAQIAAYTKNGSTVQIKLTGESGSSYGFRWPLRNGAEKPDLLIALKLSSFGFTEIYNGPYPVHLLEGRPRSSTGQLSVSVSQLKLINPSLLTQVNSFANLNRSFPSGLRDIA